MEIIYNLLVFQKFCDEKFANSTHVIKNFLTPLTIRLVFRICVLFIIGSIVPIPDRLWNQAFVNIPLRISPKCSHETPLYRPCMTNFITRPLPIANYVISTQWGRITSQFPLLSRVKHASGQKVPNENVSLNCRGCKILVCRYHHRKAWYLIDL